MASAKGAGAALDMFRERLLRKAYRPGRRPAECPVDVFRCEEEFGELVAEAAAAQPMDRGEWHRLCNDFSDRWDHVCHWVHPSRLADFLEESDGLRWTGEYPARTEAQKSKAKVKSNIKAQRFLCPECDVECNSYAQYAIHAQGAKHLDIVEALRKREAACGRAYVSPGAVPLDTSERAGGSPQAYFKKDDASSSSSGHRTPQHAPAAAPRSGGRRTGTAAAYAALLAMSTVSMVATRQQQQQSQQEYFEPSLDTYGCWGGSCGEMPFCLPEPIDEAPLRGEADDDDDDDKKKKKGQQGPADKRKKRGAAGILFSDAPPAAGLNPDAVPFSSDLGRAYSLPTHDRWGDASSDSASTAESTPAHSSARSVSSRGCDDAALVARLTELIEDYVRAGTLSREDLLSELRAADVHAVSAALLAATVTCDVSAVTAIAGDLASSELNEALGADLTARVSAGPRVRCTDAMDDVEAEYAEEFNVREHAAYAASLGLALALCAAGAVAAESAATIVRRFCANVSSPEQLPAPAVAQLVRAAQKLPCRVAAPELSPAAPRGLRQVVAALQ